MQQCETNKPFLPAIRAEEQMNRSVIKLRLICEVCGDHLPDTSASIREPPPFSLATFAFQEGEQPSTLRRFSTPVKPFQDHQSTTPALTAPILHSYTLKRSLTLCKQAEATRSGRFSTPATKLAGSVTPRIIDNF